MTKSSRLSHVNEAGEAHMVDVSDKPVTARTAIAEGFVAMKPETLALLKRGDAPKGDVLATARIAGIMAAKRTHELIPLCHPLALAKVTVDLETNSGPPGVRVVAEVKTTGRTGVEMEALTAVSVTCLTLYDMLKAVDRAMIFERIRLIEKSGGRSGDYRAEPAPERSS
ncbi:MAG: cyclic pyranopterin monophosphate synthase MoaC [Hyphomicrobium sp.]